MTRSHPQTQINLSYAQVTGDTPAWTSPVHDLAGNMTTIPRVSAPGTAQTTVYDAWNRLVELRQTTVIADYKYDGRGRRIFKSTTDESRDFYYSNAWQDLEERVSGTADTQYVWGLRYVDELICRDYDSDSNGTLEQRMYALQDANFNLTSIVDTSGDPQERYLYSPYGVRSFLTPFFASRTSSSYLWSIGHQGLLHDYESGLVYNRNRMLHPKLGRFVQRDPLEYVDGMGLYEYVQSNPIVNLDTEGLLVPPPVVGGGVAGAVAPPLLIAAAVGLCLRDVITTVSKNKEKTAYDKLKKPNPDCPKNCIDHHIATIYPNIGRVFGITNVGDTFRELLAQGGWGINSGANRCPVCDVGDGHVHSGPHDPRYHRIVYDRLWQAIQRAKDAAGSPSNPEILKELIRQELLKALDQLCCELNTRGNELRNMVTR